MLTINPMSSELKLFYKSLSQLGAALGFRYEHGRIRPAKKPGT
jgi:hypothetical protein